MKRIISAIFLGLTLLAAPVIQTGCSSTPTVAAYKSLASVQTAVDHGRNAFLDAVNAGRVEQDTIKKALDASQAFNAAFNTALITLKTTQAPSPENVTAAATAFLTLIAQFIR